MVMANNGDNTDDNEQARINEEARIHAHIQHLMSGQRRNTSNELASLAGAAAGIATRSPLVGVGATAAAKVAMKVTGLDEVFDDDKDD
jgi:hypothetical protein